MAYRGGNFGKAAEGVTPSFGGWVQTIIVIYNHKVYDFVVCTSRNSRIYVDERKSDIYIYI